MRVQSTITTDIRHQFCSVCKATRIAPSSSDTDLGLGSIPTYTSCSAQNIKNAMFPLGKGCPRVSSGHSAFIYSDHSYDHYMGAFVVFVKTNSYGEGPKPSSLWLATTTTTECRASSTLTVFVVLKSLHDEP
ncbi:hypothetical protein VNO77_22553 [Canavalia gladiata]|uniref:Uncharacterized protein n=1 Tax=Canavalia gladiata TaxID=3824 RepID=A0AAN9L5E8_CANGL